MNPKDGVGSKKAHLRHVPPALMIAVGEVMQTGAMKYGPFNWREQPVSTMTYVEAMFRHLLAYMDGQDNAEDSGLSHLAHIAASAGILLDAEASGSRLEDRAAGPAADMLRDRDRSRQPDDAEPKVYKVPSPPSFGPAPFTGSPTYMCCGQFPEHALECVNFEPIVDPEGFDSPTGHYPVEQPDGCYEYRGVHVHPSVASEQTFRDIDRDIRSGYRPSAEF